MKKLTLGLLMMGSAFANSTFQIGGNYTYVTIDTCDWRSFSGNLGGLQGSYEYKPRNDIYGGLKASWKEGTTKSGDIDRSLLYIDVQERLGYSLNSYCGKGLFTLFTGFGYRHLGQTFTQCSRFAFTLDYNEFYVPVGLLSDYLFNSCFSLGLNFVWMPQVYPTVKIEPINSVRWILDSTLNNVLVELPLSFYIGQGSRYALILKPFYEHWEDGRTPSGRRGLSLPGNVYNFWGSELNFAYSF